MNPRKPRLWTLLCLVVIFAAHVICWFLRSREPFFITLGFWDAPITINGAYRLFEGLIPHADYPSPLGPVSFMIPAFGMALIGKSMAGYLLGVLTYSFACSVALFLVMRLRSIPAIPALLVTLTAVSYLLTPRVFNYDPVHFGLLGIYNTEAYLASVVVFFELWSCVIKEDSLREQPRASFFVGMFTILLAVTICFLKITFGAMALLALAVIAIFRWPNFAWRKGLFYGLSFSAIFWLLFFKFEVKGILTDYLTPILSRPELGSAPIDLNSINAMYSDFHKHGPQLESLRFGLQAVFLAIIIELISSQRRSYRDFGRMSLRILLVACLTLGAEALLAATISQQTELYLTGFLGLSLSMIAGAGFAAKNQIKSLIVSAALLFPQYKFSQNIAMKNIAALEEFDKKISAPTEQNHLEPFKNYKDLHSRGFVVEVFNQLMTEQTLCGLNRPRIITVGFPNLYTPAKGLKTPNGAPLYEHYGVTFSNREQAVFPERQASENILHDVQVIAVTDVIGAPTRDTFLKRHQDYLTKNFSEQTPRPHWRILCRNHESAGSLEGAANTTL